jgi:hypothetical protein
MWLYPSGSNATLCGSTLVAAMLPYVIVPYVVVPYVATLCDYPMWLCGSNATLCTLCGYPAVPCRP